MTAEPLTPADAAVPADTHLEQAYRLEAEGNVDEALAHCQAAIEQATAVLAEAHNLRGILLEGQGQFETALQAYAQALHFDPALEEAADNLRELEAELGISHKPVTVTRFRTVGEADLARGRLEAAGIWCFVAESSALGHPGGIPVQVQHSDLKRASAILGLEPDEADEEDVTCPRCHSRNVRVPLLGSEWRCKKCGHRWTM